MADEYNGDDLNIEDPEATVPDITQPGQLEEYHTEAIPKRQLESVMKNMSNIVALLTNGDKIVLEEFRNEAHRTNAINYLKICHNALVRIDRANGDYLSVNQKGHDTDDTIIDDLLRRIDVLKDFMTEYFPKTDSFEFEKSIRIHRKPFVNNIRG
ncbi:MAG: hypothetical protein Q9M91_00905 [Candidatus Dojkabacteria bacterium]|nr:hypothetical protein [Candidatus Dojkabacteria bacterium]MDQ7020385.1 hypothetical protein [Candidatus Dojkabacteria bacterium]